MIIVTGGAGFIGSNLINFLSKDLKNQIVSVDWNNRKNSNYFNKIIKKISPDKFSNFLNHNIKKIDLIVHLGAITSTTEKNINLIKKNNIDLSIFLWNWCVKNNKRFIYASSAATYGDGKNKFEDKESFSYLSKLLPLNLYGWSKHIFDKFVIKQKTKPRQFVGLKFFNVYGPNEFHKDEMRSIVLKVFQKISNNEKIKLFKSHNPKFKDGEQVRDFIYIKDVVKIILWFIKNHKLNGIFNVGTGMPRSFNDLVKAVFKNSNKKQNVEFIDTPKSIRDQYQYFTKANISKLRKIGYKNDFYSLEEGIEDYIKKFLIKKA